MSTKKETKKQVCKTFWIPVPLAAAIRKFQINVSDTCREALSAEVLRVSKGKKTKDV